MNGYPWTSESKAMRAILRRLHGPDIWDLSSYRPPLPDTFGFLVQIMAGPSDGGGEESFDVVVCTPKWIEETFRGKQEFVLGRHHLIVFEYDYVRLRRALAHLCESCEGESWPEVAKKLARIGKWEFEDYRLIPD